MLIFAPYSHSVVIYHICGQVCLRFLGLVSPNLKSEKTPQEPLNTKSNEVWYYLTSKLATKEVKYNAVSSLKH